MYLSSILKLITTNLAVTSVLATAAAEVSPLSSPSSSSSSSSLYRRNENDPRFRYERDLLLLKYFDYNSWSGLSSRDEHFEIVKRCIGPLEFPHNLAYNLVYVYYACVVHNLGNESGLYTPHEKITKAGLLTADEASRMGEVSIRCVEILQQYDENASEDDWEALYEEWDL